MTTNYLTIDLGATSGRSILATFDGAKLQMKELTRFKNPMLPIAGHIHWNLPALYSEVLEALRVVAREGIEIESLGIDTWGVDFAFFGSDGSLLGLPYCYRDTHTQGATEKFFERYPKQKLYQQTGIQFMDFNSIFQMDVMNQGAYPAFTSAAKILFVPDALIYMLTGKAITEYTIASTSQLLNCHTRQLDAELMEEVGVQPNQFAPVTEPGTVVGTISQAVQEYTGMGPVKVVAVASHDTASAVASVPAKDRNYAYLSCGTWSLLGIESPAPIVNEESFAENFTNEGGIEGTTRFLKNICGLWLMERCRAEFKDAPAGVAELSALCEQSDFDGLIFPDYEGFANPKSMTAAITAFCEKTGQKAPQCPADYMRCIFRSLALRYRQVIGILESLSGISIERLHVIGGGSLNRHLMQLAANAIARPVICGPTEGTALGNALMQLKADGKVGTITAMREISAASTEVRTYMPQGSMDAEYERFIEIQNKIK